MWVMGGSCLSPGVLARPPPALGVPRGPCCPQGGTAPSFQEPEAPALPTSRRQPPGVPPFPLGALPVLPARLPRATFAKCEITAPRLSVPHKDPMT